MPSREELADERAHARRTDPWTSHAAAESIGAHELRASQERVLELLREHGPGTDSQIAERYERLRRKRGWPPMSPSGLRTRRRELCDKGLAHDSRARARLPSGRASIIWAPGPAPVATPSEFARVVSLRRPPAAE